MFRAGGAALTALDALGVGLRLGHIVFALFWIGAATLLTFVIAPKFRHLSPRALKGFITTVVPSVSRFMWATSLLTLGFGIALYAYMFDIGTLVAGTTHATIFLASLLIVIAAVLLAAAFVDPIVHKMVAALKDWDGNGPPPKIMMESGPKLGMFSMIEWVLLLVVVILMVVGTTRILG